MLLIKLALRNIFRRFKKSLLMIILIASGMMTLFVVNSIFESTNSGLRASFVQSLTGDLALCPITEEAISIFGNETPIVSEYVSVPPIINWRDINNRLNEESSIESHTSIVSGNSLIQTNGYSGNVAYFGIDPKTYFSVCDGIVIQAGSLPEDGKPGILINSVRALEIEKAIGRPLNKEDSFTLSMMLNGSFVIRKLPFSGVYKYTSPSEALNRVVLIDLQSARSLSGYLAGYVQKKKTVEVEEVNIEPVVSVEASSINDDFESAEDVTVSNTNGVSLKKIDEMLATVESESDMVQVDSGAYNFVLIKTKNSSQNPLVLANLKSTLLKEGYQIKLMNWRDTAGNAALILFAIQMIFYIGILFIAIGAMFIITNGLVISVLERTAEIGTMRALGANKVFISKLFIIETMILTLVSSIIGIFFGAVIASMLSKSGIALDNSLLISLFGGAQIKPVITIQAVFFHLAIALVIGSLSWLYPVKLALAVEPVSAMNAR